MVKDAIHDEDFDDPVLDDILSLIINSIQTERHLYNSPLEEPAFYQKYLRRWVEEGLEELKDIKRANEKSGENE
jgi:hypothetical protein